MKLHISILSLFGIVALNSIAQAGVDLVKLRDSTDEQPAFGTVDFSYLRTDRRRKTDHDGNIKLPPPPHDRADPIQVCPEDTTKYGACFRQLFPTRDGRIWLLTLSGARAAEQQGKELAQKKQFKPAAALTAIASDFYKEIAPKKAQTLLRNALTFLAWNYKIQASEGDIPDKRLRQAVPR